MFAKKQFAGTWYFCPRKDNRMRKITLPFLNCKSPIPVICLPLINGSQTFAIVDTGAEISLYDKGAKETNPDLFVSSKHLGAGSLTGISETVEKDFYVSKIEMTLKQKETESVPLKFVATEHDLTSTLKPLVDNENLPGSIPFLFGSDLLTKFRAKIDMRKRTISLSIKIPAA